MFGAGKVKSEGALGWPSAAHTEFSTQIDKFEKAKSKDDFGTAADLAEQAVRFAQATDRTKKVREELAEEFKETARVLSGVTPSPNELKKNLATEMDEDRRGGDPGEILKRVLQIKKEAGELPKGPTGKENLEGPKRDKDFFKVDLTTRPEDDKAQKLREARDKFIEDYKVVEAALARLADMVAPAVPPLAAAVAGAKGKIVDNDAYEKGESTVATMLKYVEGARVEAENAAKTAGGVLATELTTLKKDLGDQSKAAGERTKPAYAALLTEVGQLEVIVKTNNVAAFSAATEQAKAIRLAGVASATAVARFNETVNLVEATTSNKLVMKEFESENNDIKLAQKTVVDTLSLYALAAAQKSVTGLKRDADKLALRTNELGPWRKKMEESVKTLEAMIKEFKKLMPKANDTTFEQNCKEAKALYTQPGVDRAAVSKLVNEAMALAYPIINNLREAGPGQTKTINALEDDRKVGRAALEDKANKKNAAEKEVKDLETDLQLLETDIKKAEKSVKPPSGDMEELARLQELTKQAKKKFDSKPKDLKGARSQHNSVRKDLDKLLLTPGGVTAESVKDLARVETLWNTAMKGTSDVLGKIAVAAAPAAEAARLDGAAVQAHADGAVQALRAVQGHAGPEHQGAGRRHDGTEDAEGRTRTGVARRPCDAGDPRRERRGRQDDRKPVRDRRAVHQDAEVPRQYGIQRAAGRSSRVILTPSRAAPSTPSKVSRHVQQPDRGDQAHRAQPRRRHECRGRQGRSETDQVGDRADRGGAGFGQEGRAGQEAR